MAKIQWPKNPQIGDTVSAYFGGAWVWDGCMWKHTCCPTEVCDYEANGGINIKLKFTPGEPIENISSIDLYYWIEYVGSYGGYPKFESQIGSKTISIEWDGTKWILTSDLRISAGLVDDLGVLGAFAENLTGPWTAVGPGFSSFTYEYVCGPYYPVCVQVDDPLNGYSWTNTGIRAVSNLQNGNSISFVTFDYAKAYGEMPIATPIDFFGIYIFNGQWRISYTYNYLSPVPSPDGFDFDGIAQGCAVSPCAPPLGVFTSSQVTFGISEDPSYSCYQDAPLFP